MRQAGLHAKVCIQGRSPKPHAGPNAGDATRATSEDRLARVLRVVVMTRMVVMMVMARESWYGDHDHHDDKQRQKLFHGRDYSHESLGLSRG
jgi:hypothetical protein